MATNDSSTGTDPVSKFKRALFGNPIDTANAHTERVGPLIGLPIFSSDALSSVAYASEAVLSILVLWNGRSDTMGIQWWISIGIAALIAIVAISYNQTIHAYPSGGGSYIVAKANLGDMPGFVAGAALLVDYVLTVAVSVAAGVVALSSAFPPLAPFAVPVSALMIALIAWANLRGVKESGALFAVPTYSFIVGMTVMILAGIFKTFVTKQPPTQLIEASEGTKSLVGSGMGMIPIFLLLRAFAAGCTALTGIEAVSNGVQAFKEPVSDNASRTLAYMAAILGFLFIGVAFLVRHLPKLTLYDGSKSVVSQVAAWSFGHGSFGFYFIQFSTAAILILAANTSFADFPRLSSLIARDGYLPRSLARQGDRLVFHNGIVMLAVFSIALVYIFNGSLDSLLPLYAVGVFTAFTLSQAGMVKHWFDERGKNWTRSAVVNGIGAVVTGIVAVIIFVTKFTEGAWIVLALLVIQISLFKAIHARYGAISKQLEIAEDEVVSLPKNKTVILVPRDHRGVISAIKYSRALDRDCVAIHVAIDDKSVSKVVEDWNQHGEGVPLKILPSPFRSLVQPVLDYIDESLAEDPAQVLTMTVPEAVSTRFFQRLLRDNVANQLKSALGKRKNVVVTNVRYFLE